MPCPANVLQPSLPIPTVFGLSHETADKTQHPLNREFLPQPICHLGNGTELIKLVSCKASSKLEKKFSCIQDGLNEVKVITVS